MLKKVFDLWNGGIQLLDHGLSRAIYSELNGEVRPPGIYEYANECDGKLSDAPQYPSGSPRRRVDPQREILNFSNHLRYQALLATKRQSGG